MSMRTYVTLYRPVDDKWRNMQRVWAACNDAGLAVPLEVDVFFNGRPPDGVEGVEVACVTQNETTWPPWVTRFEIDMKDGYDVDVTKLPKDVKIIRFTNSY